jgi:hypothetical protein
MGEDELTKTLIDQLGELATPHLPSDVLPIVAQGKIVEEPAPLRLPSAKSQRQQYTTL